VIAWEEKPEKFIANALSPAKIVSVEVEAQGGGKNSATVFVPEDQLSLAIGKDGRNVRLAAQLTGWKIDIKPQAVVAEPAAASEEASLAPEGREGEVVAEEPKKEKKEKKVKKEKAEEVESSTEEVVEEK
jgi:N utilization substance protein A